MQLLVCHRNCQQSVKKGILCLQTDITSKSAMSPTKPSEMDNPVEYSSTAATETLSNSDNSSGGGSLEPNNQSEQQNNNNNDGKTSYHTQSNKEEHYGQLKYIQYYHFQQFEIFTGTP